MTLLEIYNMALRPHGKQITEQDLVSPNPPYEVEVCNTYYKSAVRKALGEADWPEMLKLIPPCKVEGMPTGKWSNAFALPKDILRVSMRSTKPYDTFMGLFLCDETEPEIYVVQSKFDCEKASDGLCELVALALSYTLCGLLSPSNNNIAQIIMQNYTWTLSPMVSALASPDYRTLEEGGPIGF